MDDRNHLWQHAMSDYYQSLLVPTMFAPWAPETVNRIATSSPRRVLEVASGTGALTRELVSMNSVTEVIATDLNPSMTQAGQELIPEAIWQTADALALPFDDASFDAVVCQFGAMFFPDKIAGFREARRVLQPAGVFCMTTWTGIEGHELVSAVVDALRYVFPDSPPTFIESVPHGYHDAARVESDLHAAGFRTLNVDTVTLVGPPIVPADFALGLCQGTPLRAELERRGDVEALTTQVVARMQEMLGSEPFQGKMQALVTTALP